MAEVGKRREMKHNRGFIADKQILCHHLHTDAVGRPFVGSLQPQTNDDRPRKRFDNKFKLELQSL